jgi:methyltransferase family protein
MGVKVDDLRLLMWLKAQGHIPEKSSVIDLGVQQLTDCFLAAGAELETMQRLFHLDMLCPLPQPLLPVVDGEPKNLDPAAPLARDFWAWLGVDYAAIDIDGSPGSIPIDLNYDDVPADAKGKYQLVTNFGTTEHVANQLNAFKLIHDLAAKGCIMVHTLPSHGQFNHGLVNYNPKFFWMLARSNGYRLLHMSFFGNMMAACARLLTSVARSCASTKGSRLWSTSCTMRTFLVVWPWKKCSILSLCRRSTFPLGRPRRLPR